MCVAEERSNCGHLVRHITVLVGLASATVVSNYARRYLLKAAPVVLQTLEVRLYCSCGATVVEQGHYISATDIKDLRKNGDIASVIRL